MSANSASLGIVRFFCPGGSVINSLETSQPAEAAAMSESRHTENETKDVEICMGKADAQIV